MELDFTQSSAQDEGYDPGVARKCFESFGKTENFAEAEGIFAAAWEMVVFAHGLKGQKEFVQVAVQT